jgi:sialate O-acetylesterase
MIRDWRLKWGGNTNPDFGFFFVQLAPWKAGANSVEALFRLAQLFATKLHNVWFVTAMDLWDPESPFGDLHPRNKDRIGPRMVSVIRKFSYNETILCSGPMANEWKVIEGGPNAVVEVSFMENSVGTGLKEVSVECPDSVPRSKCAGYELMSSDGNWVAATAKISGDSIRVSAKFDGNSSVTGVRYGFAAYPLATLRNNEDWPAIPFVLPNPINPMVCLNKTGKCSVSNTFREKVALLTIGCTIVAAALVGMVVLVIKRYKLFPGSDEVLMMDNFGSDTIEDKLSDTDLSSEL